VPTEEEEEEEEEEGYVFVESTNYETLYNVIFTSLMFHSAVLLSNLDFSKSVLNYWIKAEGFRSKQTTSSIAVLCMPFTNTSTDHSVPKPEQ
jgi:hypothetical protein